MDTQFSVTPSHNVSFQWPDIKYGHVIQFVPWISF